MPEPGDPQSLNRYSYTRNNPLKYTDPTGHFPYTPLPFPDFWLPQAGQALNQLWMRAQPYVYQLATDLSRFASSPLAQLANQQAQITDAAAKQATSNAGNGGGTANPGGLGPNDPWDRFSELVNQGTKTVEAAVRASTQGKGDRFVIGPYHAPPGTLNYIDEATQHGGKYFDAGTKLWGELVQKGLTEQVNRQVIYEQMKAGVSRIDISSGYTIRQVLDPAIFSPDKWLVKEVGWIQEFARVFGYVENAAGTGWVKP